MFADGGGGGYGACGYGEDSDWSLGAAEVGGFLNCPVDGASVGLWGLFASGFDVDGDGD